jgi:tRNA(Ile)-lysidine synthase
MVQEDNSVALNREEFNALPQAYKRRMLRKAVDLASADTRGLSSVQVSEVIAFMAAAQTGRIMRMPYGLIIEREYEKFVICFEVPPEGFSYTLEIPGVTLIPVLGMEVEAGIFNDIPAETSVPNYRWRALFDYDKIEPLLTVRNRQSGDWFCPTGMGGRSKKLQDYFVDEKIPRHERDTVPILLSGNDVLWVVGLRTDNRFLPGKGTKRVLMVQVRREQK